MIATSVHVVVPVHNEEDLLQSCLDAIQCATATARDIGIDVRTVVVLDACTDRSALIAQRYPVEIVEIDAGRVGVARRVGTDAALRRLDDESRAWVAHTDADSIVPGNWITHQVALSAGGSDVMIGTVRPDFADLTLRHVQHWHATHTPGRPNGHVHGANLGVRAGVYRRVGGFAEVPEHEDVAFAAAAQAAGFVLTASDVAEVMTSGRFIGRTPGGYAGYLAAQEAMLESGVA